MLCSTFHWARWKWLAGSIDGTTIVGFNGFVRGEESAGTVDLSQLKQFALRVQLSATPPERMLH